MNLRALSYFVALTEQGSFSAAADSCDVSQSTVSTQIKKLEKELGVDLIDRSQREVKLTRSGEQVLAHAKEIGAQERSIKQIINAQRTPQTATFKLGLFPTISPYLLPHVMPKITETYSELDLQLIEEKSEIIVEQILNGILDIGILALPVPEKNLSYISLFDEDFLLAVGPNHSLANQKQITVDQINTAELMLLSEGHCLRDHALEVCSLAGTKNSNAFEATSLETLRHMVAADSGITLMPRLSVEGPSHHESLIQLVEFAKPKPKREIGLFWKRSHPHEKFFKELSKLLAP